MGPNKRTFRSRKGDAGNNIADTNEDSNNSHIAGTSVMSDSEQVRPIFSEQEGVLPFTGRYVAREHRNAPSINLRVYSSCASEAMQRRELYYDSVKEKRRKVVDSCLSRMRLNSPRRILRPNAKVPVSSDF